MDITKERINKILATGANVILTTGGIDDLCLKYFVEAGAMAVRLANLNILSIESQEPVCPFPFKKLVTLSLMNKKI